MNLLKQVVSEVSRVKSPKSKKTVGFVSQSGEFEFSNKEALKAAIFNGRRSALRVDGDSNTFTTFDLIKQIEKERHEKKQQKLSKYVQIVKDKKDPPEFMLKKLDSYVPEKTVQRMKDMRLSIDNLIDQQNQSQRKLDVLKVKNKASMYSESPKKINVESRY